MPGPCSPVCSRSWARRREHRIDQHPPRGRSRPGGVFPGRPERGWGDGLPLVPPTPERVSAALEEVGWAADEVIAVLPPCGPRVPPRSWPSMR